MPRLLHIGKPIGQNDHPITWHLEWDDGAKVPIANGHITLQIARTWGQPQTDGGLATQPTALRVFWLTRRIVEDGAYPDLEPTVLDRVAEVLQEGWDDPNASRLPLHVNFINPFPPKNQHYPVTGWENFYDHATLGLDCKWGAEFVRQAMQVIGFSSAQMEVSGAYANRGLSITGHDWMAPDVRASDGVKLKWGNGDFVLNDGETATGIHASGNVYWVTLFPYVGQIVFGTGSTPDERKRHAMWIMMDRNQHPPYTGFVQVWADGSNGGAGTEAVYPAGHPNVGQPIPFPPYTTP